MLGVQGPCANQVQAAHPVNGPERTLHPGGASQRQAVTPIENVP